MLCNYSINAMFDPNPSDHLNELVASTRYRKDTMDHDADVHELKRNYDRKEKEYAFLLNRRLRRAKHPFTQVTNDPLLDHRISEETDWYVKQKQQYPSASLITKKNGHVNLSTNEPKRSNSAPVRRTGQSEPPTSQQAAISSVNQLSSFGRSKTPNRERISHGHHVNIGPGKWTPPKLRKTCMAVGYVHNTWPETDTAEYEKKMYQLQLADERKNELLKAIDEQLQHRKQAQQLAHVPPPVKEFMHMTEAEIREHRLFEEKTRMLQHEVGQREAEIRELQSLFNSIRIETALNSVNIGNHPTYYDSHLPLSQSTASQRILKQSLLASHQKDKQVEQKVQQTVKKAGKRKCSVSSKGKASTAAKVVDVKPIFEVEVKRKPPVDIGGMTMKVLKTKAIFGSENVKQKSQKDKYASVRPSLPEKPKKHFADTYDSHRAVQNRAPSSHLHPPKSKSKLSKCNCKPVSSQSLARTELLLTQQDQEASRRLSLKDILSSTQIAERYNQPLRSLSSTSTSRAQVKRLLSVSPLFKSHNLCRDQERIHKLETSVLLTTTLPTSQHSNLKPKVTQQQKNKHEKCKTSLSSSKSSEDHVVPPVSENILLSPPYSGLSKGNKTARKYELKRPQQEGSIHTKKKKKQKSKYIIDDDKGHMLDLPGYLDDLEAEVERSERQFDNRHLLSKQNKSTTANDFSCDYDSDADSQTNLFGITLNPTTANVEISGGQETSLQPSGTKQDKLNETSKKVELGSQSQQNSASTSSIHSRHSRHSRALDRITKNQQYNAGSATTAMPVAAAALSVPAMAQIGGSASEDTIDQSTANGYRPVSNASFASAQQQTIIPQKSKPSTPTAQLSGSPAPPAHNSTGQQFPDAILSPKTLLTNNKLLKRLEDKEVGEDAGSCVPIDGSPQAVTSPAGMDAFTRANVIISIKPPSAGDSPVLPTKSSSLTSEENGKLKKMQMLLPVIGKDLQPTIVSQFEKNRRYDHANPEASSASAAIYKSTTGGEMMKETHGFIGQTPPPKHTLLKFSAKKERQELVQQKKKDKHALTGNNPLRRSAESEVSLASNATSSSAGSNRKKLTGRSHNKKRSLTASWNAEESPRTWAAKQRQHQPPIKSSSDVKGQMNTEWQKIYDAISAVEVRLYAATTIFF